MADVALRPMAGRHGMARRPALAPNVLRLVAVGYVGLLVLVPVVVVFYKTFEPGLASFWAALQDPDAVQALRVTAVVAGISVLIDAVFGVAVAILLVRYRFPGRRLLSALIDLPIAVSPIVVGLALLLIYSPTGWFGPFVESSGVAVLAAKPGMVLATVFVSLPLVARAVAPVLEQAGLEQEQAAASLGANAVQRFIRVTLPTIRIALAYGVVLSLARCVGEYGAVLVVSGNVQGETETAPLRIGNLVQNSLDTDSAYAITFVLMLISIAAIAVGAFVRRGRKI